MGKATGLFIRKHREAVGLSQAGFASRLKLKTKQLVSKIERGVKDIPRKHVDVMAHVLRVPKHNLQKLISKDKRAKLAGKI